MIPRYTRPEMAAIWDPQTRFRIWFEIEAHAADAHGRARRHSEGRRQENLGQGQERHFRRRAHRCDRARGQARRHRLPHASRRDRGTRGALRASGHDLLRRARHLLQRAAGARRRSADRRRRQAPRGAARGAPSSTRRTPTIGRSHGIHAEPTTFGVKLAYAYAEFFRAKRTAHLRRATEVATCAHFRARSARSRRSIRGWRRMSPRRWDSRSSRSRPRSSRATATPCISPRSGVVASSVERLATEIPPSAAHRGAGGRGVLLRGPEGLLRHAAQAQSGAVGERHRPCPHGARLCDAGAGERRALARARHLALLGRAHDRPGRHRDAGLRADAPRRPSSTSSWSIPPTCRRISTCSAAWCIPSG